MSQPSLHDKQLLVKCLVSLFGKDRQASAIDEAPETIGALAEAILSAGITTDWKEVEPEIIGGSNDKNRLGMMLVRRRRQLVYSIKPSNFLRDPLLSASAAGMSIFATYYTPAALSSLPQTFPGFLIGLTFTVLRAFAHPVGYGEAALLHLMNRIQESKGMVTLSDLDGAGSILVDQYDYVKGTNNNEVKFLLRSLVAWRAIESHEDGYYIRESVPFGLGPLEYIE